MFLYISISNIDKIKNNHGCITFLEAIAKVGLPYDKNVGLCLRSYYLFLYI